MERKGRSHDYGRGAPPAEEEEDSGANERSGLASDRWEARAVEGFGGGSRSERKKTEDELSKEARNVGEAGGREAGRGDQR